MIRNDPLKQKGIVWLASYPKSGNTWLRVFLYQLLRITSGRPRERDELNHIERASTYETRLVPFFERFLGKPLASASLLEVMKVRPRVQALIAERMPATGLVKTHNLLGTVLDVPTINPAVSVGAIYVVRDPRDVASSLARFLESSVDRAIEVMNTAAYCTGNSNEGAAEVWGSWSEHVTSWTGSPDGSVLVVRYEDMLGKPTETFTAIAQHLRQPATPIQVNEAVALASFEKLKGEEERTGFVERTTKSTPFFVSGKAGGWQKALTPAQISSIEKAHAREMARFKYA